MAYTAWSVVFGEQPSAAKWNILGTNDASFNDGTGIANLALSTTSVSNPYKFSAYHNTTQSLATGTVVGFNTELFDTNNNYDGVNKYTAPVSGFYQVNAAIYYQSGSTVGNSILLYKNGAVLSRGNALASSGGNDICVVLSQSIQLAATDYIQIFTDFSGGGSKTVYGQAAVPRYTQFGAYLISQT